MAVRYKPADMQNVIPYLVIADAEKELAFMKEVFGAKETHVSRDPAGRIAHASVKIGDSVVMMGQAGEQWPPLPAAIYLYVLDVDAAHKRARRRRNFGDAARRSVLRGQERRREGLEWCAVVDGHSHGGRFRRRTSAPGP